MPAEELTGHLFGRAIPPAALIAMSERFSYYNGTIAWLQGKNNDGDEMFYWNGTDTVQITDKDIDNGWPSLYDGKMA